MEKTAPTQKPAEKSAGTIAPPRRSEGPRLENAPSLHPILNLQRSIGNQAVSRLLRSARLHMKLRVSQPGDDYEQEADRLAEQVIHMPVPAVQRKCTACFAGAHCPKCDEEESPLIQRRTGDTGTVINSLPDSFLASLGPGRALDSALRDDMKQRFGHDFSRVRVHTGAAAEQSARDVSADAYTVGHDIVFDSGRFAPGTLVGRRLLVHELAHVVQQSGSHRDVSPGTRVVRRQSAPANTGAADFYGALSDRDYKRAASHLSEMNDGDIRTILEPLSSDLRSRLRNAALQLPAAQSARVASVIEALETEVAAAKPAGPKPGGEGASKSDAAGATPQQYVSVGLSYEVVGVIGGGAPTTGKLPTDVQASLGGMFGTGGAGAAPIVLAAPGGGATAGSLEVEPWLPGLVAAPGTGFPRFVDPIPGGAGASGTNVYTRFIGPESAEGFFDPSRLRANELAPRYGQPAVGSPALAARFKAFEIFKRSGISPSDLDTLSTAVRSKGVTGLSTSEAALLERVTNIHGQVAGATPASPLLSLTEHAPDLALKKMPPVASNRAYVVRVRIQPDDVGKVNEILKRAGQSTEGMAGELEVVVAQDLAAAGEAAGAPKVLSIVANPAKGAPLGGLVGPALKWGGRGLVFLGAALAVKDVLTAEGPHRRETEGRAFGSFAGGTVLGALGAGLCIGLGVATAGVGILLCGLAFGVLGAVGGSLAGGAIGRKFD